jgi:uncharacterized protein YjbI with pentapeptide repeats
MSDYVVNGQGSIGSVSGSVNQEFGRVVNNFGDEDASLAPMPPPPSLDYVNRCDDEARLSELLLGAPEAQPIVVIYGAPGTGKASLARYVIFQEQVRAHFGGGVLWGDLSARSPEQQAWSFITMVKPAWKHDPNDHLDPFERLRQALAMRLRLPSRRTLIVLDKINGWEDVWKFKAESCEECRVLVLANQPCEGRNPRIWRQCALREFKEDEALEVFVKNLGPRYGGDEHRMIFSEIAQICGYLPELVGLVARQLGEGKETPRSFLDRLKANPSAAMGNDYLENVELLLRQMPADQGALLEYSGLLGNGGWPPEMLAAVALRPVAEVLPLIEALLRLGLIDRDATTRRYRTKTLFRELARERLSASDPYRYRAAGHLLARYCLDTAQDVVTTLANKPNLKPPSQGSVDAAFVREFRDAVIGDLSHFERVLALVEAGQEWNLLRRFAYLPYAGLLQGLAALQFNVSADLIMATLDAPLILGGRRARNAPATDSHADGEPSLRCNVPLWRSAAAHNHFIGRELVLQSGQREHIRLAEAAEATVYLAGRKRHEPYEAHLTLIAGRVIGGTFAGLDLVELSWTGVRADRIIFCDVDLVNARLLGCDLRCGMWIHCDMRRSVLVGSNLSFGVLRDVNLRGADLRGADLRGAQLERVDLRGADLRGADLSGASLAQVNLHGARLDHVRWAEAKLSELRIDTLVWLEVDEARKQPLDAPLPNPYRGGLFGRTRSLASYAPYNEYADVGDAFAEADLRCVRPGTTPVVGLQARHADIRLAMAPGVTLEGGVLLNADLRLAQLYGATFDGVTLRGADLSGADLFQARLRGCNLGGARLVGVDLAEAHVEGGSGGSDLSQADLRLANLSRATLADLSLEGGNLAGAWLAEARMAGVRLVRAMLDSADLSGCTLDARCDLNDASLARANLSGVTLANVTLQGAILAGASLQGANCAGGQFRNANLSGVDLSGADLTGADLTQANLSGANLSGANLSGASLSGANLSETTIDDEQLASLADDAGVYCDRARPSLSAHTSQQP